MRTCCRRRQKKKRWQKNAAVNHHIPSGMAALPRRMDFGGGFGAWRKAPERWRARLHGVGNPACA